MLQCWACQIWMKANATYRRMSGRVERRNWLSSIYQTHFLITIREGPKFGLNWAWAEPWSSSSMEATSRLLSWVDLSTSDVVLEVQRSIASLDLPTILNLTPRD